MNSAVHQQEVLTATTIETNNADDDPEFDDTTAPQLPSSQFQDPTSRVLPDAILSDFLWTPSPQAHAVRRRAILEKHPEIESLYGNDTSQAIGTAITVFAQLCFCYYVSVASLSWWRYFVLTLAVSGTLNHSLFAAMHEGSHRTIFAGKHASELFCILATVPMGLPAAIPFKRYHLDHHIYMGVDSLDPDLPTEWEAWFFRTTARKFLWVFLLPATYSLRPMITRPKKVVPMDIVNWLVIATVDLLVLYYWGWRSLGWFLIGSIFSMNFHPMAGHFIAEHFVFPGRDIYQETSSYYGLWNLITYNLGYHTEHHDFPRVPGSRLPEVRKLAPEFYSFPERAGWMCVMWEFLLRPSITPYNRIKRVPGTLHKLQQQQLACPKKQNTSSSSSSRQVLHSGQFPGGGAKRFWPLMGPEQRRRRP